MSEGQPGVSAEWERVWRLSVQTPVGLGERSADSAPGSTFGMSE